MFLRQSTAQVIRFGPCLDITDGVTEETALTLAQADMRLSKDGGAYAQKSAAGNATHDSDGHYSTTLSTTDTATVGELRLNVHQPANMLPVWDRWWVIEEAVYDAFYGAAATGYLQPTTAGRTLDILATGEVPIDLDSSIGTLAAAQIEAAALNGKGDWNVGKTGYSLTQAFPTNFADLSIVVTTGLVDITQVAADKVWTTTVRTLTAFSTALALSVWDVLETAILTASSIGLKVKNNLDAVLTDRTLAAAAYFDPTADTVANVTTVATATNLTNAPTAGDLTAAMKTSVNAEVVDVMDTDTVTLPGQEAPPLAPTRTQMWAWLYKIMRNRTSQTATLWSLFADNETTLDAKATVSDDATTAIKQEIIAGP